MRATNTFALSDYAEQAKATGRTARALAGEDADARKRLLEDETGYEHRRRWSLDAQTYTIERAPIEQPERPWNMSDNRPATRRPDFEKTPSLFTAYDRLILDAKGLKMLQWLVCNEIVRDGRSTNDIRTALQAGLDAQYGRGHFWAYNHGPRIAIQCRYPLG